MIISDANLLLGIERLSVDPCDFLDKQFWRAKSAPQTETKEASV